MRRSKYAGAWVALTTMLALGSCAAPEPENAPTPSPTQPQATTQAPAQALSKDETCAELNNIVKASQDERGIVDHRPFIAEDLKDLAERAHPDIAPDLNIVADTANEPNDSEPANAANLALDDACKITEFLTEASGEDQSAPEATPEPPAPEAQMMQVSDLDGYTFDVELGYTMAAPEMSIENDQPGFATAVLSHSGSVGITNTTEGRNLEFESQVGVTFPTASPHFFYAAVYSPESLVCTYSGYSGADSDEVCKLLVMSAPLGQDVGSMTLAPAESRMLQTTMGNPDTGETARLKAIPEELFDQVAQALMEPLRYEIFYSAPDSERFEGNCGGVSILAVLHASDGSTGCEFGRGLNWLSVLG